jgi:uncharacterized protein (TIGR02001 family)
MRRAAVSARAGRSRPGARGRFTRVLRFAAAAACIAGASPAAAEIGSALSLFSQADLRGYSVSNGHPVAVLDFSYDDSSGLYGALSGTAVASSSDLLRPLSLALNGGYARKISSAFTLDLGVTGSLYSHYSKSAQGRSYAEVYAGLSGKRLSSRISFSPHYFLTGKPTLYGELNGNLGVTYGLRFEAHVGMLVPLNGGSAVYRRQSDWRLGVARELGRVTVQAAWVGRTRAPQPFGPILSGRRGANALIAGVSVGL